MKLKSTKALETNKHELEIEVPAEDFAAAINEVYKTESKKMTIPGFRKGKAPRAFIEKFYGSDVFFEAAVNHLYRPTVMEAVDASKLDVISVGEFSIDKISREDGILCRLNVVVKPEAEIDDYMGIEVEKPSAAVTEKDVDDEIERVRKRNARMITVEDRPAQLGDTVVIDFDGYVDDLPFEGGKAENHELKLGAGQFIPGFEDQVEGHSTGEEFEVKVRFPEDYHAEELKGKDSVFKVKLHEIKTEELPEVDDEFAKDVSEFDSLEEYKKDIEKKLEEQKEKSAENEVEGRIIEAVCEKLKAEIPEEMISREAEELVNSFAYRLQSQGLTLENYLKYTGGTVEQLLEQYKPQAERQVKLRLGLEKIAEKEGIEPDADEMEAEYKKLAEAYEMELDKVKEMISDKDVSADIKNRKAIEFLKKNAKITEKPSEENDKQN